MEPSRFDKALHDDFCRVFGELKLGTNYLKFARRYAAPFEDGAPKADLRFFRDCVRRQGAEAHVLSKFRMLYICQETINGWSWRGSVVFQRYNMFEIGFEGENGTSVVGDTMLLICQRARELVPENEYVGPPYSRPRYDGNDEHLEAMIGDLVAFFSELKTMIREDLRGFPKGSI